METRTSKMEERAKNGQPLTDEELDNVVHSLEHLTPSSATSKQEEWAANIRQTLKGIAHISHKDWTVTSTNAQKLLPFLIPNGADDNNNFPDSLSAHRYHRILNEGNWQEAVHHRESIMAGNDGNEIPGWAVLVTGVNGIRKTTSMHQPWFGSLLEEALVYPPSSSDGKDEKENTSNKNSIPLQHLPTGENSFFRQLDHMIATLCNKEFAILYALTEKRMATGKSSSSAEGQQPSSEDIQAYSNLKAAIFTRYRTLSELFGVLLLQQAQKVPINCLLETSGRDVAMFRYVDHVFPASYQKLVLHFVINDLRQAQDSVDRRMVKEIATGIEAIQQSESSIGISRVVHANAGGPYGSEVLPGVQEASDKVWDTVVDGSAGVGQDWFKATIQINAYESEPWTAQAIRPDGSKGTIHTFE